MLHSKVLGEHYLEPVHVVMYMFMCVCASCVCRRMCRYVDMRLEVIGYIRYFP